MRKLFATVGLVGLMLAGTAGTAFAATSNNGPTPTSHHDAAQEICIKSGGVFVRPGNLLYVCFFPGGSTQLLTVGGIQPPAKNDEAGQLCQKSGGLFIRVDNLVYACLFPNALFSVGDILGALPGLFADQPATTHCDKTFTGSNNAVINVPSGQTYCLVNLKQVGAVNVASGGALSVTDGSVINGAVTATGATAFTFCDSSTVGGAINVSMATGFVLIGNGGDGGPLAAACGPNQIDGAVTLTANTGGVEIGGNAISGALTVSGNIAPNSGTPTENNATEIEANTVTGLTTCATNSPPPVNDGRKNTFTGGANGQCADL